MRVSALLLFVAFQISFFAFGNKTERSYHLQRIHSNDIEYSRRLAHIDSLIEIDKSISDSLCSLKIDMAFKIGDYRRICRAWNDMGKHYVENMPIHDYCRIALSHVIALARLQDIEGCLSYSKDIINLEKPDSLLYYDALTYMTIHGLFIDSQPISDDYLDRVTKIYEKAKKINASNYCMNRIKYSFHSIMFDRTLHNEQYDESLNQIDIINSVTSSEIEQNSLMTNKALVYMIIGKYAEAEEIYNEILKSPIEHLNKGITLINYTHLLNQHNRFAETLEVIDKYKDAASYLDVDIYRSYLMGNKAIAEYHVGNHDSAFKLILDSQLLRDSLNYNASILNGVTQLENERLKTDNELMKKDKNALSLTIAVALVLLVVMAVICAVLLFRHKNYKKISEGIKDRNIKLEAKCTELLNGIDDNLKIKDGKLSANMIKVAELEETIERIRQIIRGRVKSDSEMVSSIKEILKGQPGKEDSRQLFERQFEQTHNSFLKKLHASHPDLTNGESRMCAYLIMNLSTKEIASITNKSIRSVESSRYRIGKKFNISDGQSLLSYLRQFC